MNNKTKAIAIVIVVLLFVAGLMLYIFQELYTEQDIKENTSNVITDAIKFKNEYEGLNDKSDDNIEYRSITIPEDNPFVLSTPNEIVNMIDKKETFLVYFGYAKSNYCRSIINSMIEEAKSHNVRKIYYVDITDIRDEYELDKDNRAVKSKEGTEDYYVLLDKLDDILDNYESLKYTNSKGKEKKVVINEKRIYAPSVILVSNGKGEAITSGIPDNLTDPIMNLSDDILLSQKELFNDIYSKYNSLLYVCVSKEC